MSVLHALPIGVLLTTACVSPAPAASSTALHPWSFEARGVTAKVEVQQFTRSDFDSLRELGARDFCYIPFATMANPRSPAIGLRTPPAFEQTLVEQAHAAGLRVLLKPHLWIDQSWHGAVAMDSEADWQAFFAAYTTYIVECARFAEAHGVEALCVGTELDQTLEHEREWRALIAEVRASYSGSLVYTANWDRVDEVTFWDALDAIGIAAYFPLEVDEPATLEAILAAWRPIRARLERLSTRHARPVVFTEIGYRPLAGVLARPWKFEDAGVLDRELQARAYEAALMTFAGKPWFGGMFWWEWYAESFLAKGWAGWCSYSPQGQPAGEVLRAHWCSPATAR